MAIQHDGFFREKISFTQVSNLALRDKKLSYRAKGLYAVIQSYITIPNFKLYKRHLMQMSTEGQKAFQTAWNELKENGYLKQYRIRDESGGFRYEYDLLDKPDPSSPATLNLRLDGSVSEPEENPAPAEAAVRPDSIPEIKKEDSAETTLPEKYVPKEITDPEPDHNINTIEKRIKQQIEYDFWKSENNPYIDDILNIMLEIATMPEQRIQMGKETRMTSEVQLSFEKIDQNCIDYITQCLNSLETPIANAKAYLLKVIYNAPKTINTFLKNQYGFMPLE